MEAETLSKTRESVDDTHLGGSWCVILYNDDWHTFDEVVLQVQKAARCSQQEAVAITYCAHTTGRAVACTGSKPDCLRALAVLREIRLQAELDGP